MKLPLNTVAERLGGKKPSAPRAFGAAATIGGAAAVATYKLLRHQEEKS